VGLFYELFPESPVTQINFFEKVRYRHPAFSGKFDAGAGQFLKSPANRIQRSDVKRVVFGANFSGKVRDRQ